MIILSVHRHLEYETTITVWVPPIIETWPFNEIKIFLFSWKKAISEISILGFKLLFLKVKNFDLAGVTRYWTVSERRNFLDDIIRIVFFMVLLFISNVYYLSVVVYKLINLGFIFASWLIFASNKPYL